ncbi:Processed neural cell adhesion molecule [Triplophysa tibetana]|uniref:Neural cell adhesion molecule L1 n=1 Tax=Triplophysa tibetana TaxID=1572043 RepID=A0A5A9NCN2_9TELE|nr:Processed neural cell adhesion molecule [Triplophysa tibetana]
MRGLGSRLCIWLLLIIFSSVFGVYYPPHVEQLPTITGQSSGSLIALPYDDSFILKCEAKGNPSPTYRWTKNGIDFYPHKDPLLTTEETYGTFVIPNTKDKVKYQGKYRCYATNKLGTAISDETEFIVPSLPKFPRVNLEPLDVKEGDSALLECNPPIGVPPRQLYWMNCTDLKHIKQDERVSMGLNGNLYFSNTLAPDSHNDYCCFASFPKIRTIVQKPRMAVRVRTTPERKPNIIAPLGHSTSHVKKGDELQLECIAEGLPTPIIQWTKMGDTFPEHAVINNFGKLLIIPRIMPEDDGKYTCTALNSAGEDVRHFHVVMEEPPSWKEEPVRDLLAEIGSDIHIKCSATGKPQPSITWKRNGRPLDDFTSTNQQVLDDSVILHGAQKSDSAVYQCEASNRHGIIIANANILVMNHPPLLLTRNYLEYATMLGKSVIMDCKVFSSPLATIQWTREDPEGSVDGERCSLLKNGSLQIHRVEKEDMGQYKCFTNNSEGTASIFTELFVKDSTWIVEAPQDMKVERGSTAELECQVMSDPTLSRELEVLWVKDGIQIISNLSEGYAIDHGTLQITNVSHSDEGNYTCIVRTSLDQNQASAYVTVLDVPDPPVQLLLSDLKERSVKLHWEAASDHNSPITEFIIQFEENNWEPEKWKELLRVASSQFSAPLTLYCHINYQFRVIAVNAVGRSHPSMPSERYRTPSCAPDRNPENIRIEGPRPHQMDITWEPLLPVEHNSPDLEYKLSYRLLGVEDSWKEQMVKRQSFLVENTPTFVPFEIKIQAHNKHGWAPEPRVVTGYSGEDLPLAAPGNVSVKVLNSTLLRVSWSPVPHAALRGHPLGYMVHWWQTQSLLTSKRIPSEKQSLTILGNRSHTMVPGLKPFSEYNLTVNVFNRKGNGPSSSAVNSYLTLVLVPDKPHILRATNFQKNSITLVWAPPRKANGFLTGYLLQYQTVGETLGELKSVNISSPDTTQWVLHNLQEDHRYKFYLSACTQMGCGSVANEEGGTVPEAFVLNVTTSISDTFARIHWSATGDDSDSELYVVIMNQRGGVWQISEAVNTSKGFHLIEGLSPETVYKVRLLASHRLDDFSYFEEVFKTKKATSKQLEASKQWIVVLMCVIALLTLLVLIGCFVIKKKGGKYAVKEKEEIPADPESHGINEDAPCDYSDEKPLKSSQQLLGGIKEDDSSEDSSIISEDDCEFNEDGSFIGEYACYRRRASLEPNGHPPFTS